MATWTTLPILTISLWIFKLLELQWKDVHWGCWRYPQTVQAVLPSGLMEVRDAIIHYSGIVMDQLWYPHGIQNIAALVSLSPIASQNSWTLVSPWHRKTAELWCPTGITKQFRSNFSILLQSGRTLVSLWHYNFLCHSLFFSISALKFFKTFSEMQTFTLSLYIPVCCFATGVVVVVCEDFEADLDLLLKTSWPMLSFYLFYWNVNLFMANILFINKFNTVWCGSLHMSYC